MKTRNKYALTALLATAFGFWRGVIIGHTVETETNNVRSTARLRKQPPPTFDPSSHPNGRDFGLDHETRSRLLQDAITDGSWIGKKPGIDTDGINRDIGELLVSRFNGAVTDKQARTLVLELMKTLPQEHKNHLLTILATTAPRGMLDERARKSVISLANDIREQTQV